MKPDSGSEESEGPNSRLACLLARCALVLARRFSDGATLWSVAPGLRDHALHVAVEFVHPAIVGKPALPAVGITEPGLTGSLRNSVREGDVIVCIGSGDDADLLDIARRGPAWGVETIWIGWGSFPGNRTEAMPLWLSDGEDPAIVRTYHLLWELTHICLEQPAVLRSEQSIEASSCPTCADELTLAEVASVGDHVARVRTAGRVTTVDTSLIDAVAVNDLLLTHAGVALQSLKGVDHE